RFLEIEMNSNSVNLIKLQQCQEKNDYYRYAFKGYIQWLLPQMDQLPSGLKRMFNDYNQRFFDKETHGRVTETISWMIIGLEMLLMYYISVNAIDKEQKLKTMEIAVEKFEQIASKHSLNLKSHDPVLLFVECFRDLINSKSVSIIDINDDPYTDDRHFVGWEDKEFYYLILGNLIKEINSYLQGQNQRFPISKYMLVKLLAER